MTKENQPFLYENILAKNHQKQASLFAKISHELKTPIHGINGIASFLATNWDMLDDNIRKKHMGDISKASDVLSDLLEAFLHLSEINSQQINFNFTNSDLVELLNISIDRCRAYLLQNKDLTVTFNTSITQAFANVDAFWFKQLITNLLDNAVSHSDSGVISVGLELIEAAGKKHYLIFVKDQGKGVPESELDNIFNEFTRGSEDNSSNKNFGLGLAICKEIAEGHGGKVWAKNNSDKGVNIGFTIPIENA